MLFQKPHYFGNAVSGAALMAVKDDFDINDCIDPSGAYVQEELMLLSAASFSSLRLRTLNRLYQCVLKRGVEPEWVFNRKGYYVIKQIKSHFNPVRLEAFSKLCARSLLQCPDIIAEIRVSNQEERKSDADMPENQRQLIVKNIRTIGTANAHEGIEFNDESFIAQVCNHLGVDGGQMLSSDELVLQSHYHPDIYSRQEEQAMTPAITLSAGQY